MKYFIFIALVCADVALILMGRHNRSRKVINDGDNNRTVMIPFLYLDLLDPRNLKRSCKKYDLVKEQLMSTGVSISRAEEGCRGDIPLECFFNETLTVGEEHAVVAMDNHGCFIQNNHANGMWLLQGDQLVPKDEIAIDEGTIVYLGKQPIRFTFSKIAAPQRSVSWNKIWVTTQMVIGNMFGFSGKNNKRPRARREEQDEW